MSTYSNGRVVNVATPGRRLRRILLYGEIIIFLGCLYGVLVKTTGLALPCIFRLLTGFQCPGCGVTRMCVALLQLDLNAAYKAHPMLLVQLPFLILIAVRNIIAYIKSGVCSVSKFETCCLYICIGLLVVFTIVRNIPVILQILSIGTI